MTKYLVAIAALAMFVAGACSKDTKDQSNSETKTPAAQEKTEGKGGHAPADVQPGSHEDWCGEHAVPESQCTRCNPELAAAFKATGDWCEEHGLPESQCLKCNPDLKITRPAPSDE